MSRIGVGGSDGLGTEGGRRARSRALRHRYAAHAALQQVQVHTDTVSITQFYALILNSL